MTLRIRAGGGLFAATAAALAIGLGANTALAATTLTVKVSGGGTISATSSSTVLTDNGISLKCTKSTGKASVANGTKTGSSPVTIGSVTSLSFSGCTGPLGPVTVSVHKLPYKLQIDSKTVSGKTDGIVAGVNTSIASAACSLTVTGSAPGYYNNSNHTLNLTPSLPTKPLNSARLTVSNVSGCLGAINNGDHPTFKATYATSPTTLKITSS
jgi:hypothetical protein